MNEMSTPPEFDARDYQRIAQAIDYVVENRLEQPELTDVADAVGLSPYHFQRLFTRWAGVSPKKFLQYVTLSDAKQRLDDSASVLDAALDAGLSGPGRLHDLFVAVEAVTPGEYKARGEGLTFTYGFHASPFGECLIVASPRGLTGLGFVDGGDRAACLAHQQKGWERGDWREDAAATAPLAVEAFAAVDGRAGKLSLLMRGTPFQVQVWEALLRIPPARLTSYGRLAEAVCTKKASRAVGAACGANLIGVLIPCHRVIRDIGVIHAYRWGVERKRAIIGREAALAGA